MLDNAVPMYVQGGKKKKINNAMLTDLCSTSKQDIQIFMNG